MPTFDMILLALSSLAMVVAAIALLAAIIDPIHRDYPRRSTHLRWPWPRNEGESDD